jgi:hypothetical protein
MASVYRQFCHRIYQPHILYPELLDKSLYCIAISRTTKYITSMKMDSNHVLMADQLILRITVVILSPALRTALDVGNSRPLYSRAAKDNTASIRVLQKCGFKIISEDNGFSNSRSEEVEEYILKLSSLQAIAD